MADIWNDQILITGGTGLIGTNLTELLRGMDCKVVSCGHRQGDMRVNLLSQAETSNLFDLVKPQIVIHLAAKVGGIYANMSNKADFYLENTLININVMNEVQERQVPYVFAMGTGCAYPKRLEGKKLKEKDFLDGKPEITNDAYAYAKRGLLTHLMACKEGYGLAYHYCIPANIYGPYDNFHPLNSHVVPALIRKFVEAKTLDLKEVVVWGSGQASRNFLHVYDLIDAMVLLMSSQKCLGPVNVAGPCSHTIALLAEYLQDITTFKGSIFYDVDQPEGQAERVFDTSVMDSLGWSVKLYLKDGLDQTVKWFKNNYKGE